MNINSLWWQCTQHVWTTSTLLLLSSELWRKCLGVRLSQSEKSVIWKQSKEIYKYYSNNTLKNANHKSAWNSIPHTSCFSIRCRSACWCGRLPVVNVLTHTWPANRKWIATSSSAEIRVLISVLIGDNQQAGCLFGGFFWLFVCLFFNSSWSEPQLLEMARER